MTGEHPVQILARGDSQVDSMQRFQLAVLIQ